MRAFLPYVIFSIFFVLCSVLYIGGCAIDKNWYPVINIIFAAFVLLGLIAFSNIEPSGSWSNSIITENAIMFLIFTGICSFVAFPLVLYHVGTLGWKGLVFQMCGDLSALVGFGLFIFCLKQTSSDY